MGEKIKVKEILSWTKSKPVSGDIKNYLKSVSTDSRTIKKGDFFIPVLGQNYNGHDFIFDAVNKGACGFVYELRYLNHIKSKIRSYNERVLDNLIVFQSEDNIKFLGDIAYNYVRKFSPVVIGITGSAGKTITKDLLMGALGRDYNVKFTPKNFNTEIGVSKSILEIDKNTDFFIAELAMRGKGQIRLLADICNVDIAVITIIGPAHLEFFSNLSDIAKAKAEIAEKLCEKDGILFLNNDDEWSNYINKISDCRVIRFGRNKKADYNFIEKEADSFGRFSFDFFKQDKKIIEIKLNIPGYHNVYNACCAASICMHLGMEPSVIKEGIENAIVEENRMEVIKKKDKIIIKDCYNANPLSVKRAIDTLNLVALKNNCRSVAILGDMLELGRDSVNLHEEIGKYLKEKNIDVLIACGDFAEYLCRGYKKVGKKNEKTKALKKYSSLCFCFRHKNDLNEEIKTILKSKDLILIKGSRANKMENIISFI